MSKTPECAILGQGQHLRWDGNGMDGHGVDPNDDVIKPNIGPLRRSQPIPYLQKPASTVPSQLEVLRLQDEDQHYALTPFALDHNSCTDKV